MGITPTMLRLLAREVHRHQIAGAVLTFGNQDVWGSEEEVTRSLREEGLEPRHYEARPHSSAMFRSMAASDARFKRFIHAATLFQMLGFSQYADLDKYAQDDPAFRWDLNEPLPEGLRGTFDLVLDFGTTEHVFRVPTVLSSVVAALKPGGRVIHSLPLPSLFWAQHGYYCFNPDLFLDFYRVNGFEDIECLVVYYPKPLLRPLDWTAYFRRAHVFPYRRGVNLQYLVPADSAPAFWLVGKRGRTSVEAVPNQEENAVAAEAVRKASRLRTAAKSVFFAMQPLLGGVLRRSYMVSMGVSSTRI